MGARTGRTKAISTTVNPEIWAAFKEICRKAGTDFAAGLERAMLDVISAGQLPGVIPRSAYLHDGEEDKAADPMLEKLQEMEEEITRLREMAQKRMPAVAQMPLKKKPINSTGTKVMYE